MTIEDKPVADDAKAAYNTAKAVATAAVSKTLGK